VVRKGRRGCALSAAGLHPGREGRLNTISRDYRRLARLLNVERELFLDIPSRTPAINAKVTWTNLRVGVYRESPQLPEVQLVALNRV
jgi:hypothetical protein